MCVVQGRAGGEHQGAGLVELHAPVEEPVPQRAAGHQLHHDEAQALALHEVEDGHDVGVVEAGDDPRLLLEPVPDRRIGAEGAGELLDRDPSAEIAVLRRQDDAPTSPADLLADVVVRQRRDDELAVEAHARRSWGARDSTG
ncbi:MAG: hypothetical protein MUF83_13205 [Acidimicrobiales bacterium]|nr:hypothetical protein [Acidimicrobiales bacterium]